MLRYDVKKIWSSNPQTIKKELAGLVSHKLPLSVCRKGCPPRRVRIRALEKNKETPDLLIHKEKPFRCGGDRCLVLYTPFNRPTLGFKTKIIRESERHLHLAFPEEIFVIERRQLPRIKVKDPSMVTFLLDGGTVPKSSRLNNIGTGGAKFSGRFGLKEGDEIGPLTFTVFTGVQTDPESFTVERARVIKTRQRSDGEETYRVVFSKETPPEDRLEHFVYSNATTDKGRKSGKKAVHFPD